MIETVGGDGGGGDDNDDDDSTGKRLLFPCTVLLLAEIRDGLLESVGECQFVGLWVHPGGVPIHNTQHPQHTTMFKTALFHFFRKPFNVPNLICLAILYYHKNLTEIPLPLPIYQVIF